MSVLLPLGLFVVIASLPVALSIWDFFDSRRGGFLAWSTGLAMGAGGSWLMWIGAGL